MEKRKECCGEAEGKRGGNLGMVWTASGNGSPPGELLAEAREGETPRTLGPYAALCNLVPAICRQDWAVRRHTSAHSCIMVSSPN